MIEINLIPDELKLKLKREEKNAELKKYVFLIPVFIGLVVLLHAYCGAMIWMSASRLSSLENKWKELEPQKKNLEGFQAEYAMLTGDSQIIQQLTSRRVNWAAKLNTLSTVLPSGIWLQELYVLDKNVTLKGTVVSLQKEEVMLINRFLNALKNDPLFFKDFKSLELGSMIVKNFGIREVEEFVFNGVLN